MGSSDVFSVLFLLALGVGLFYSVRSSRARKRKFEAFGARLGVQGFEQTATSIRGSVRGRALHMRFVSASGRTPEHTLIELDCAPSAFLLHLRLQNEAEQGAVERGQAVDLAIGDPTFDAAWIVEGAPAERVRRLLAEPRLRARLQAFAQAGEPSIRIEDGKLILRKNESEVGPEAIATERIELALALAEAVIADAEIPLEAGEINAAAATYRAAPRVDPEAAGAASIAELKHLRATRAVGELRQTLLASHAVLTGLTVASLLFTDSALVLAPTLTFVALFVTAGLSSTYRKARRGVPGVSIGRVAVLCTTLALAADGALSAWAIAKG